MSTADALVQADGLTKLYGRTPALRSLSLQLPAGKVVGLLGPNGAGKTTLLRMLTGSLRATEGVARVLGLDPWRDAAALHRRTTYLPGDLRMAPDLTGEQQLRLYAALRGQDRRLYSELADRLSADLHVPMHSLSKGNRQKVGLVQALAGTAEVVLLDEATSGLDPLAQEVVEQLVREAADRGALVLLSSHVLSEVERVADDVVMLRAGRLVAVERLEQLREAAPHRVRVRTSRPWRPPVEVTDLAQQDGLITFTAQARALDGLVKSLAQEEVLELTVEPADLESLFIAYYAGADDAG
jgi:ABC-2 type transport system ATP-binding protein